MLCPEFRQNLSLYVDDALAPQFRAACDEHLRECPLCRADLADMRNLTASLQGLETPFVPFNLAEAIKNSVAIELASLKQIEQTDAVKVPLWQKIWEGHLRPQLVPYSAGAMASLLFFIMMFASLLSSIAAFREMELQARRDREQRMALIAASVQRPYESLPEFPAADYAVRRLPVAAESPSLNPQSRFIALTASLTRGEADDDAIMVVADVLENGFAKITDVIEPPSQPQKLAELEKLLNNDPAFVPATLDRRPENVRVVFLIQKVDVGTIDKLDVRDPKSQEIIKNTKTRRL